MGSEVKGWKGKMREGITGGRGLGILGRDERIEIYYI